MQEPDVRASTMHVSVMYSPDSQRGLIRFGILCLDARGVVHVVGGRGTERHEPRAMYVGLSKEKHSSED